MFPRQIIRDRLAEVERRIHKLQQKQLRLEERQYTLHEPHRYPSCREELSRVERRIRELNAEQLELDRTWNTCQTYLDCIKYPVSTLPPEIMALIFIHLVDSEWDRTPSLTTAPLLLLLVCKAWQDIALATPQLWTRLALSTMELPLQYGKDLTTKMVPRWCMRAKALPLSLDLMALDAQDINDLRTLVSTNSPRLESLTATVPLEAFPFHDAQFPLLERVTLRLSGWLPPPEGYPPYTCFENAPRLREVCLLYPANPALFILPLTQLTKFTGDGLTADRCLDLLRSAPSLVECTLHVELDDPPLDQTTRAVLPQLKCLTIERSCHSQDVEHTSAAVILDLIDAPALERLELFGLPDLHHYADEMVRFFSRVSKSLRRFSYTFVFREDTEAYLEPVAVDWLDYLPDLTHVQFYNPTEEFMGRFIEKITETAFLPRLRSLRLIDYTLPVDIGFLVAVFIRSCINLNAAGRARLEVFNLIWRDFASMQSLRGEARLFESCVKEGCQMYMGVPGINELAKWIKFPRPVYFHA